MVSPLSSCEVRAALQAMTTMQGGHDKEKARYLGVAKRRGASWAFAESGSYMPDGAGASADWLKRSASQRAAIAPANAVPRVRTSAAAVGHGPGTIGSNGACVRPRGP